MKKLTKTQIILIVVAAIFLFMGGIFSSKAYTSLTEKKAVLTDSIATLNKQLIIERNRYQTTVYLMDSISRKGGTLTFTNGENKVFDIHLTPKTN